MFMVKIRVSCQLRKKPTQEFSPFLKELIYQGPLTIFLLLFLVSKNRFVSTTKWKKEAWQYHLLNVNQLDHVLSTIKYKCIESLDTELNKILVAFIIVTGYRFYLYS